MEPGNIVEFIDRQKIICAVVLDMKKMRLRLLTEGNREISISAGRLSHKCDERLDLAMGRDRLVDELKQRASRRKGLIGDINIRELWEVLNSEQEWIDLSTMTTFCFPEAPNGDHEAAVIRAFFNDRQYFKFNPDRFFPNTEKQVEQLRIQTNEMERKNRTIERGSSWLKYVINTDDPVVTDAHQKYIDILKSYYLFEKESRHYEMAKEILARNSITRKQIILELLIKLRVWHKDENLDLLTYEIPVDFSSGVAQWAESLVAIRSSDPNLQYREDLTQLPVITIDGQATFDFDDALSIQKDNNHYILGIHIADVAHYVKRSDPVDKEALVRGSSIYMPDQKIPMIPPFLAEDLCSLKAGQKRPAISLMARVTPAMEIVDYEISPSMIAVNDQLTYYEANQMVDTDERIGTLFGLAKTFQQKRLDQGALPITLPEINTWIDEDGTINVTKTNRESPGRLLVAELMIFANWIAAKYLDSKGLPAVFRSQPGPKERLFKNNEGTLYQNWMQRKQLSRFALGPEPGSHSGLGLDAYVTSSSPIRKYFDLITQRQLRASLGLEAPYVKREIEEMIQQLEFPMSAVSRMQYLRHRYWLLKSLEDRVGEKEEGIIVGKRKNTYFVLLTNYMLECALQASMGTKLNPEDLVQVTIQRVNARKDVLTVYIG